VDGYPLRAFGGVRIEDPALRVHASDLGVDRERSSGFAEQLSFRAPLVRVDAGRTTVNEGAVRVENARVASRLLGLNLVRIDTRLLEKDQENRIHLEGGSVRLLGFRVYGIDSFTSSASSRSENGTDTPKKSAKGRSPTYRWLKLPSFSFFDGSFSLSYNNALKFAGRWTGITSFRLSTDVDPSFHLAGNYNLRKVTNDVDTFISSPDLQNKFLGSYFYTIRNQEPFKENDRLFRPILIAGFATSWNQSYEDQEGDRNEADIPLSLGIGSGGPIGRLLGYRAQLNYEQVQDKGFGEDTRFAFTGVVGPRPFEIVRGANLSLRAEGTSRFGGGDTYTWYRANAGITLLPIPWLRLSGSYFRSWESGTPRFPYDQVVADRGLTARIDLMVGLARLGYMNQFSQETDRWVRNQFYISYQVGIAEPFVAYDEQFNTTSFGLNLNVSAPFERIRHRRITGLTPAAR
jgi:hypothetical protein